jgi:hypothetical protein
MAKAFHIAELAQVLQVLVLAVADGLAGVPWLCSGATWCSGPSPCRRLVAALLGQVVAVSSHCVATASGPWWPS